MKIIEASYEILTPINRDEFLKIIEGISRVCYKSEDKITETSAAKFVRGLIRNKHEAMIEHAPTISVKFICDRGVSHEIVRSRLFSFAQESTRYCNYSKDKFGNEITVIDPNLTLSAGSKREHHSDGEFTAYGAWKSAMLMAETHYFDLLEMGVSPQEARSVLPNSLKTEIVVTGNVREWRHFFKLRADKTAHPQMRELTLPLLKKMQALLPELFDDIEVSK